MKPKIKIRISAGGVVIKEMRGKKYLLLTKKIELPKWQIPKGGINTGENLYKAAKREVYEETGLKNIKVIKKLGIVRRKDTGDNSKLKIIHHYLFTLTDPENLNPPDKTHAEAKWFTYRQAIKNLLIKEQKELLIKNKQLFI